MNKWAIREKESKLPVMKTFCLFKVFPIALHLGKACLKIHMKLKSYKPSGCV
jgi:hypothetical protein